MTTLMCEQLTSALSSSVLMLRCVSRGVGRCYTQSINQSINQFTSQLYTVWQNVAP